MTIFLFPSLNDGSDRQLRGSTASDLKHGGGDPSETDSIADYADGENTGMLCLSMHV